MPDPLLRDPSGTAFLRRQFGAELNRYYKALSKLIRQLVVTEDAFGLERATQPLALAPLRNTRYAFQTNSAKLASFKRWLQEKVDDGMLRVNAAKYIKSAYQQGISRAYLQSRAKEAVDEFLNYVLTSRERFLRVTLSEVKVTSKLETLYTRAYDHLEGVNKQMSIAMGRILADGLLANHKPRTIARELVKQLDISRRRALLIARTELVRANAEGMLDAYERLGISELGLKVEWTTADNPCPLCRAEAGKVYKIEKAHGLIPLHPRCLCSWTEFVEIKKRKRSGKRRLTASR